MNNTIEALEAEWHEKNVKPFNAYGRTSHVKAWWRCSACRHEWQSTKSNRTSKGSGCPECRKKKVRGSNNAKWNGYGEISGSQWHYIQRGVNAPFEITIEYAWELFLVQERKCVLSGNELTMWGKVNGEHSGTASLDLIDSSNGYVEDNVRWIDKRLQHMKRNLPNSEFINLCEEVASYQSKKKLAVFAIPSFNEWQKKKL